MKKYFKIMSLVLSICLLSLNVGFNTYALENDTLYYQGVAIEQKELSEDTLEWLGWYNSLSPDEQDCINYEPLDLQKMIVNPEDITVSEPELDELDIDDIVPFRLGAPVYNPSWWNNSNRIKEANCYAYSMDLIQNFVGKLQPGQLSGRTFESLSEQVSLVLLCVMVLVQVEDAILEDQAQVNVQVQESIKLCQSLRQIGITIGMYLILMGIGHTKEDIQELQMQMLVGKGLQTLKPATEIMEI